MKNILRSSKTNASAKSSKSLFKKKALGQNFLVDQMYIDKIINALCPKAKDTLIEIGPGIGALTRPILERNFKLTVIEIDKRLPEVLSALANASVNLNIILKDVLSVDFNLFPRPMRVFGNLPYNISTPILTHLFKSISNIKDMHFMLQKEVVDRMIAPAGTTNYGRLSIFVQYYCQAFLLFCVPPSAFDPAPKVESAVVRLVPFSKSPYDTVEPDKLFKVVSMSFLMRRKTIFNNLKKIMTKQDFLILGIDPNLRPQDLTISEYIKISNMV